MEAEFVVRILMQGLLLLVPDYGPDGVRKTGDDQLFVLLPDARLGPDWMARHDPYLVYCTEYGSDGTCATAVEWPLAEGKLFEELQVFWVANDGSQTVPAGGVKWSDQMEEKPSHGHPFPPKDVTDMVKREDFDWTVRISDVLGGFSVLPRKECLFGAPMDCREIVARAKFLGGDALTCSFVKSKNKGDVPVVRFERSSYYPHAMAQSVVLELRRDRDEVEAFRIGGSTGEVVLGDGGAGGRQCGDDGKDWCATVLLTNRSAEGTWSPRGEHYHLYYGLLDITPPPTFLPIPVVASQPVPKPVGDVEPNCWKPFGPETSVAGRKDPFPLEEDRPICPVGTP